MRGRVWVVLVGSLLLVGCGGSGAPATTSGNEPETEQSFSLGLLRGDTATTTAIVVVKPFEETGTLELLDIPAGAFAPLATSLPMTLPVGDRAVVRITFTPPAVSSGGSQEGTVRLLFRPNGPGAAFPVLLHIDAEVERPSARLVQTKLELGGVPMGETVPCGIYVENTSQVTPITVSNVKVGAGDFVVAGDALPLPSVVAPGGTFQVRLAYSPTTETNASSLLRVFHSADIDPLEATLSATGIAPRLFVEYGAVPLDPVTGETGWLTLNLKPEAVGVFLEVWGDPEALIDLAGFEGPSGKVYETEDLAGPLNWLSGLPAGELGFLTLQVPDSAQPDVQLEPGGGTYRFRLRQVGATAQTVSVRATITQRRLTEVHEGTLDLHVFLADGIPLLFPADPLRDTKLLNVLKTVDAILGASGIRLGEISFSVLEPPFDVLANEDETAGLIAVNSAAPPPELPVHLNLFLVNDISYGITGVAGASPGPWANGMPFSGVVVAYDSGQATAVGVTAAHEIAHYLGALGTAVLPQPDDTHPMLRHPLLRPGLPEKFLSAAGAYEQVAVTANSMPSTSTWCGTCAHAPVR